MGDFFSSDNFSELVAFAGRHQIMVIVFFALLAALIYVQARILIARVKKLNSNAATAKINHENGVYVEDRYDMPSLW